MTVTQFCHGPIPRALTWKPQGSSNATSRKKGQMVQGDEEHRANEDLVGCECVPHPVPELLKTQCAEQRILNEKYKQAHLAINTESSSRQGGMGAGYTRQTTKKHMQGGSGVLWANEFLLSLAFTGQLFVVLPPSLWVFIDKIPPTFSSPG